MGALHVWPIARQESPLHKVVMKLPEFGVSQVELWVLLLVDVQPCHLPWMCSRVIYLGRAALGALIY